MLRYRTDETDDGLWGEEGTFTICSFWLVSALIEIGKIGRGRRLCERLLSLASPLELYAEELDPHSGRHLGNFPQAFTHLALVNAVMHVIRAEEGMDDDLTAGKGSLDHQFGSGPTTLSSSDEPEPGDTGRPGPARRIDPAERPAATGRRSSPN